MGKIKNLEKKAKPKAEFDKKSPESRKKSINDAKLKKVVKAKDENVEKMQKVHKKKKLKILQQIKKEVEDKKTETKSSDEPVDKLVKREIVKKAVIALKDGISKEIENSDKKNLFDEELRLGLQIVATKIPQCPPHTRKILLDHSLFDQQPDICFFIRDQLPKKGDQEENIRNFEEKLSQADVTGIKTIMPLSKLKNDYKSINLKLKLCNTYDIFLVECEIAEHVYSLLGKNFIVKRKRPIQIDTKKEANIMKMSIENAIRKVSFKLSSSSNLSCFEVGTVKMENVKIADNIMTAIEQLKEKWPGSWKNISRLYLKPMRQSKVTIPIYYSNINPNDVEVPVIKGAKQNRLDKLAEELKQKSKKLKMDLKMKKVVKKSKLFENKVKKNTNQKEVTEKKKPADETVKNEASEPVKKKKKQSTADDNQQPADKKEKNKKVEVEATEATDEPAKKKKKKHQKDVNIESNVDTSEAIDEMPAIENKKKKKHNKNKASVDDTAEISEISVKKNKKKKEKKNKD